ncbi:MAG: biotin--[acetyl-CoA-carboxylase] ligase [Mycobacterium kyogaense]|uniref:biotin--[acetyl-CoA-carboxylase] ligase n=1 Tax=Mycobacterium kyogaense TaxID=2212479 RepID=UPI002FF6ADA5
MPSPQRVALNREALVSALDGTGWRRVDVVEDTGSTNADLVARAAAGEDIAGAVLLAEHQSAGRGRHGRRWSAPPRTQIAVSVGVDTTGVAPESWGWLPLLTGLAVAASVRSHGVDATVKWPNDVLAGSGKLAGILAEVAAPVVVVGVGLNVGFDASDVPDPNAVSMAMLGADVDRTELAATLLRTLSGRIEQWRAGDVALAADYRGISSTIGTRVRALLPGDDEIIGVAIDVDDGGRLIIDRDGSPVTVSAGDITHLRPAD